MVGRAARAHLYFGRSNRHCRLQGVVENDRPRVPAMNRWTALKMASVALVLGGATVLRLAGLSYDQPLEYHPDEWAIVKPALNIVATGDPNPHGAGHVGRWRSSDERPSGHSKCGSRVGKRTPAGGNYGSTGSLYAAIERGPIPSRLHVDAVGQQPQLVPHTWV
jgi:hypothetical protein